MRGSGVDAKAGKMVFDFHPAVWSGSGLYWLIIGIMNKVTQYHGYLFYERGPLFYNQLLIAYLLFWAKIILTPIIYVF